jgi:hypothetical protein
MLLVSTARVPPRVVMPGYRLSGERLNGLVRQLGARELNALHGEEGDRERSVSRAAVDAGDFEDEEASVDRRANPNDG